MPLFSTEKTETRSSTKVTADFSASQTAQTLWTPASGKKIVITGYTLSFTADDGVITVFDTTDNTTLRVFKCKGKDGGGAAHGGLAIELAVDGVLKYTTAASTTGHLTVYGYEL